MFLTDFIQELEKSFKIIAGTEQLQPNKTIAIPKVVSAVVDIAEALRL
jgi:hypothetical protein